MSEEYLWLVCRLSVITARSASEVSYRMGAPHQREIHGWPSRRENRSSTRDQSTTFQNASMNSGRRFWYYR
jgi:hypothetical protein